MLEPEHYENNYERDLAIDFVYYKLIIAENLPQKKTLGIKDRWIVCC